MTCNGVLLLGQENSREMKKITFIDAIFYFRQFTQLFSCIWKVPFEERSGDSVWL